VKIAVVVMGGLHPSGEDEVVPSWLALFEALARSHELHAFVLKHLPAAQTYQLRGFTVHDLGRPAGVPGLTRRAQERALTRAMDESGPFDLVHGFWADPAGQLAARAGRRLGIPSVVTCDSGEFVSLPSISYGSQRTRHGRRAVREACEVATTVHVCTDFMRALAAARGISATVIPLTSVTSQAAHLRQGFHLRQGYGGQDGGQDGGQATSKRGPGRPFRVVQVASLSRVKNQQLLIDALRIVRERIDARLDLIGEDTLGGQLQRHAAAIGVEAHITFHGFLRQDRVLAHLAAADLYVQSSLHEAAGVSVLEAAVCGLPIVGTRAGYVADWAPAKAVAVGDAIPASLADTILALHADPDRARSMAGLARTFAIAHDAGWSASQFDRLYRSLISG
jgi:glycosyltransferase involved in cell wall biosynthesis